MNCPHCTAVLPDDDLFCEECGQRLAEEHDAASLPPLCLCGAPEGDLDHDGYCLQCGRRCRPAPGEHEEIELSAGFASVTDRGLRHARNEDRCQIASDSSRAILVVCDGVSNSTNADAAAAAAAECIANGLLAGNDLQSAFEEASAAVSKLANRWSGHDGAPSTTAVAALVENGRAHLGWIGDSRAYWIAPSGSQQLTMDHSWMNAVVASGELTYAEAAKSPQAHGITRWIGADADSEIAPEIAAFDFPGPGWLLLCTDGLWNYAAETADLAALVLSSPSGATALDIARQLIAHANQQGGHDNVTVALLRSPV